MVDETNHAVVTQFGKITATKSTPGLQFKTPFIQNVSYLDKRILTLDTPSQEFLTSDEKRLLSIKLLGGKFLNRKHFSSQLEQSQVEKHESFLSLRLNYEHKLQKIYTQQ